MRVSASFGEFPSIFFNLNYSFFHASLYISPRGGNFFSFWEPKYLAQTFLQDLRGRLLLLLFLLVWALKYDASSFFCPNRVLSV